MKGGMRITEYRGKPFNDERLEEERRERVADVVLVSDLADRYDRHPATFLKFLKRNDIELDFIVDTISGQRKRCVPVTSVQEVEDLIRGENTVVSVEEALNGF